MPLILLFQFGFIIIGGAAAAVSLSRGKITLGRAWSLEFGVPGMAGFGVWLIFAGNLTGWQRLGAALGQALGPWAIQFARGMGFPSSGALFNPIYAALLTWALVGVVAASMWSKDPRRQGMFVGFAIPVVALWYGTAFIQLINNVPVVK